MATNETTYSEYQQQRAFRSLRHDHSDAVSEAVDTLQAAVTEHDDETFRRSADAVLNLLEINEEYIYQHGDVCQDSFLEWDSDAVLTYLNAPDRDALLERVSREFKRVLAESLTAVAVARGTVNAIVETEQPAYEYATRVGTRYVRATSKIGGELQLIDPGDDLKATLLTGGQGAGKSTALASLVEDRIERGHAIVDLVDFHKAENAMYDVEGESNSPLQKIRASHGLDTGFGGDYEPPEVSILAPLTHHLEDSRIPLDKETGEPVVEAFAIPASDLTFRQLVMLMPHSTTTQQKHVKAAHQYLEQTGKDWTLYDFAQIVRDKTNAGDKIAESIERSLKTVQQKSFVRDKESEFVLDWDELMQRERHVSAFTVHMIRERSDKLAVLSYLIDSLYDARQKLIRRRILDEYPPLTAVMRELHTIAPRTKSEQDAEKTTEGYMIDTLADLLALMRHVNMDILADTQKFYRQLSPRVSGLFHRVYCFKGQKRDIREVFNTRVDDTGPVEDIAQYPKGQCALVNQQGATYPIAMSPPRHHHLDAKADGDGLSYRTKVIESEVLRESPYNASIPPRLRFRGRYDPRVGFWDEFVVETNHPKDYIVKTKLTDAYNEWAKRNDYETYTHNAFCSWVKRARGIEDAQPVIDGRQRASWRGLALEGISVSTDTDSQGTTAATSD